MKILLLGSTGYLGQQFLKAYPKAKTPRVEIADRDAVRNMLDQVQPDIVINCAGKTGRPNVDWCEDHKEETLAANVTGPVILLRECLTRGIYLVHMSSGCIYEGNGSTHSKGSGQAGLTTSSGGAGFTEDDVPNFYGSFYSRSKAWSDQIMRDFPVLTLRIRMPFDGTTNDRNLIMKLRKYPRVLDVQNSLTYMPDFLHVAKTLIERKATGIYNVVNEGSLSPYALMLLYKKVVDPAASFDRLALTDLSDVVKAGRSNCLLSTEKLRKEGLRMRPVQEAAEEALRTIQKV